MTAHDTGGNHGEIHGLKSEALRLALHEALRGKDGPLEMLLARHGAMPSPRPNLKLAAAFGVEVGGLPGAVVPMLSRLAACDAEAEEARVFLLIAAAHGFVGRVQGGKEVEAAWRGLAELAADERAPVRLGTMDALVTLAVRPGGGDALVARAAAWLDGGGDGDASYGAVALVLEVVAEPRVPVLLRDRRALFEFLSGALNAIADAPRSAQRIDSFRRLINALPRTLITVVATLGGPEAAAWLETECGRTEDPAAREVLSKAVVGLQGKAHGHSAAVTERLRGALGASAKPLRHAAKVRPGTGRGKKSRRIL